MRTRMLTRGRTALQATPLLLLVACQMTIQRSDPCEECEPAPVVTLQEPLIARSPTMMALARDLDQLERSIDHFGSVTVKTPDVWGQARLTSHREDVEKRLRNELDGFRLSKQGSISRTDMADLLVKLSFSNTGAPSVADATKANAEAAKDSAKEAAKSADEAARSAKGEGANADAAKLSAEVAKAAAENAKTEAAKIKTAVEALDAAVVKAKASGILKAEVSNTDPKGIVAEALAKGTTLEPVRILDQKDRYLSYTNQLRRKNEGDDTSDAPGYSLNLVRLPVSLLPGSRTDSGHGAEVTMTMNPILDKELLPNMYKELAVNDVLRWMSFPLTKFLEDEEIQEAMTNETLRFILNTDDTMFRAEVIQKHIPIPAYITATQERLLTNYLYERDVNPRSATQPRSGASREAVTRNKVEVENIALKKAKDEAKQKLGAVQLMPVKTDLFVSPSLLTKYAKQVSYSVDSKGNRSLPPTMLPEVLGPSFFYEIARLVNRLSEDDASERRGIIHMPTVQNVLREHLIAAYRFLARPENSCLWEHYCTEEVLNAVRNRDQDRLTELRRTFRADVQRLSGTKYSGSEDPGLANEPYGLDKLVQFSATTGLAWAILVESALLNTRLMDDMKRTESVTNTCFALLNPWPKFYLPDPPAEERQAFNSYVKHRWPIHVFTLDPATDDQNLDDKLTSTRTSQLALTLAFLSGKLSSNAFINATRKLTAEYETIELNRTQVGFANGNNTFGWRFYPRFQSPRVRSNLVTFIGSNVIGLHNPNDGLRSRKIEVGPRECTAVVLMPSFVPNATLEITSNWFPLANPRNKRFDHTQTLQLSRHVQAIRTSGFCVTDADKYRQDDLRLLMNRTEQLSTRLPMQLQRFQVPTDNTLGGFELFGNTTTDLAPELYGWYGAPGLSADGSTTLFLVGDHFSVNHTKVLVGNVEVKDVEMLSRQVMKITVPQGALPLQSSLEGVTPVEYHAHVHLATPYGISRELEIPLICPMTVCPKTMEPEQPAAAAKKVEPPKPGYKASLDATLKVEPLPEPKPSTPLPPPTMMKKIDEK